MADAAPDHRAPWRSPELTAYYERKMDEYVEHGSRHLVFTPPTTRGSLITRCESWAVNLQRDYVPTLTDAGRWPEIMAGSHPDTMSRDQRDWLSSPGRWGECAVLWADHIKSATAVTALSDAREAKKHRDYANLVMRTFADFEHSDRRDRLTHRSEIERRARQRL